MNATQTLWVMTALVVSVVFASHQTEIVPDHLYLGPFASVEVVDTQIDVIVSAFSYQEAYELFYPDITMWHNTSQLIVHVFDSPEVTTIPDRVLPVLRALAHAPDLRILVHCYAGLNRSVAVMALMLVYGGYANTAQDAYQLIAERYPRSYPPQVAWVQNVEKILGQTKIT